MQILPIEGLGLLLAGPEQPRPVAVWHDGIVSLTRLPGGRCLLPMLEGEVRVQRGGNVLARSEVDLRLVPRAAGRFALDGPGTLDAWMFLPEPDVGILAGERPAASAPTRLDLSRRAMPHRVMTLAVQVRDGDRRGPVRFFTYRPDARAAPVSVDHASGHTGPVTHIRVDPAGLDRVQVEVVRRVRQTGQVRSGRYELNSNDDAITFEDLLHGDEVDVAASPPFALAAPDGAPVQRLTFRYRAVPEPRLEVVGHEPLQARGGLHPLSPEETAALLAPVAGPAPTWHEEWPVAAAGGHATLREALEERGVTDLADEAAFAWWLGVVEARQDVEAAGQLLDLRIRAAPGDVDRAAAAAARLESFPAHIFAELDGTGPTDALIAFQERVGMVEQPADAIIRLAEAAQAALEAAVAAWQARLAEAGLDWIDGVLPPLDEVDGLGALAARLQAAPEAALADLWDRRNRIWRRVPGDATRPIDVRVRRLLLDAHLQDTVAALARIQRRFASLGATLPDGPVDSLESLARRLGESMRSAEPALARLAAMPLAGAAFIEDVQPQAEQAAAEDQATLTVWAQPGVPGAVRGQAQRLMERWGPALQRAHTWSAVTERAGSLELELDVLAHSGSQQAAAAARARDALHEAVRHHDPARLAELLGTLRELETELLHQREVWQRMVDACSPGTRDALGLNGVERWAHVEARVQDDLEAVRDLARRVARMDRRRGAGLLLLVDDGGELERAARAFATAPVGAPAARALLEYDRVRQRIPERLGGSEALESLESAFLELVHDEMRRRVARRLGRDRQAALAALDAHRDIDGVAELRVVALAVEDQFSLEDALRLQELLDHAEEVAAWQRVQDRLRARLRSVAGELGRYMGDQAPRWSMLDVPENAIAWLHAMSHGRRDDRTGSDPAMLAPGNRRLMEHTLREQGLWLA